MKKAIHFLITVCLLLCMIAPALVENESSEYVTISSADEADFLNCVQHYIDTYNQCGKAPWCWVEKEWPELNEVIHYPYMRMEVPFFNIINTYQLYFFSNGHIYYLRVNGSVEEIVCVDIVNSVIVRGKDCFVFSLENLEGEVE